MTEIKNIAPATLWNAVLRGARNACPRCARGKLFARFLRATPCCASCDQDWTLHQADDFPPYLSILITGHVMAPFALIAATHPDVPSWISTTLILSTATCIAIGLLQPAKGAIIALQWWLGMHGFKQNPGRPPSPSDIS